jgi:hypothetical protein
MYGQSLRRTIIPHDITDSSLETQYILTLSCERHAVCGGCHPDGHAMVADLLPILDLRVLVLVIQGFATPSVIPVPDNLHRHHT